MLLIIFLIIGLYSLAISAFRQVKLRIRDETFEYRVYSWWGLRMVCEKQLPCSQIKNILVKRRLFPSWGKRWELIIFEEVLLFDTWGPEWMVYILEFTGNNFSFKTTDLFYFKQKRAVKLRSKIEAALTGQKAFSYTVIPMLRFCLLASLICFVLAYLEVD